MCSEIQLTIFLSRVSPSFPGSPHSSSLPVGHVGLTSHSSTMVLSKASVWYETVLKPLRRLTSATSNALSFSQRHPSQAPSPPKFRAGDEYRADSSPVQERVFTAHSEQKSTQQQQKQTWRDFLQNPLDVILNDSHSSEHPVHLMSQRLNKPFSTSVVDQARGKQPEKQTPHPLIERPARRPKNTTTQVPVPRSPARQKEFGSKKYRKYFREKIIRKGPNFNIRRRNRLCMESYLEDLKPACLMTIDSWKDNLHLSDLRNDGFSNPVKLGMEEGIIKVSLNSGNGNVLKSRDEVAFDTNKVTRSGKKKETSCPICCASGITQKQNVSNSLISNASKVADTLPVNGLTEKSMNACSEKASLTTGGRVPCCKDTREIVQCDSDKWPSFTSMRNNLQEAAQGFKCNLWKKAVAGDALFQPPLTLNYSSR